MSSPRNTLSDADTCAHSGEQLHAMLHSDDIDQWKRCNTENAVDLDVWVRDHVLHVLASCPNVLSYWKDGHSPLVVEVLLYRRVAAALETLDDNVKAGILRGVCKNAAEVGLFHFIKKTPVHWTVMSPAWIGPPESDLRAAAVERGWSSERLSVQVYDAIERPAAQHWSEWVPYAHTLAALHFGYRLANRKDNLPVHGQNDDHVTVCQHIAQAWARPEDMALAHTLSRYAALPWKYTIGVHPDAQPVLPELQKRVDALVHVYMATGMLWDLGVAIMQGTLPGMQENNDTVALPPLDMFHMGG